MDKIREQFNKETGIDSYKHEGNYIIWLEKQVEGLSNLVLNLNDGVMKSTLALEVLNTKVKEQEATIMKLNNGLIKTVQVNQFKRGLV